MPPSILPAPAPVERIISGRVTFLRGSASGPSGCLAIVRSNEDGESHTLINRAYALSLGDNIQVRVQPSGSKGILFVIDDPAYGVREEKPLPPTKPLDLAPKSKGPVKIPVSAAILTNYLSDTFPAVKPASARLIVAALVARNPPEPMTESEPPFRYEVPGDHKRLMNFDALLDDLETISPEEFAGSVTLPAAKFDVPGQFIRQWQADPLRHRAVVLLYGLGLNSAQAKSVLQRAEEYDRKTSVERGLTHFTFNPLSSVRRLAKFPYRLTLVPGIGFNSADSAAQRLGVAPDSDERIVACAREVLGSLMASGSTMIQLWQLSSQVTDMLSNADTKGKRKRDPVENPVFLTPKKIAQVVYRMPEHEDVVFPLGRSTARDAVSLARNCNTEQLIAKRTWESMVTPARKSIVMPSDEEVAAILGFTPNDGQQRALKKVFANPFSILTGGPGTGKSSITRGIVQIAMRSGLNVKVCAPTGAAAKRASDVTGVQATTIHNMLGAKSYTLFSYNEENPLDCDLLCVDESGMNDINIQAAIMRAVKSGTRIVLIGDPDQLPSVGPGAVLADLVNSGVPPVARLTASQRLGAGNPINDFARDIREGIARLPKDNGETIIIRSIEDENDILKAVLQQFFHYRELGIAAEDIAVLTPVNRGMLGTNNLNLHLQREINPSIAKGVVIGAFPGLLGDNDASQFRAKPGDRVIQIKPDSHLRLVNGDVGMVRRIDDQLNKIWVQFSDGEREISGSALRNMALCSALTVHRSQGNEFKAVITVLPKNAFTLTRASFYTGVTRSKGTLTMVGNTDTALKAINTNDDARRSTLLAGYLMREHAQHRESLILDEHQTPPAPLFDLLPLPEMT